MEILEALSYPSPTLVWGLLSRGLGVVFLISFASLAVQVLPIAGRRGVMPVALALRAQARHFPSWRRFFYFPTLLWLNASDAFLLALPITGILASVAIVVGGPLSPWAFLVCYLAYLSLDRPLTLVYPWDSMLFEAGFWGMLLPATHLLPDVSAVSAPLPAVAWVYRLLGFRVLFGFGKHKFIGTTPEDSGFLKSFMVSQPLPTKIGWLSQKLPLPVMKLALVGMFLVEIPLPLAVFFPGPASSLVALAMMGLMVAIQLTGNFGYFNIGLIVVALSWMDNRTAEAFTLTGFFSAEAAPVHALVAFHTFLAVLSFPFNTFCSHTWHMWSPWTRLKNPLLRWPAVIARTFHPFRVAHAYGVFPPQSPPPMKLSPVTEVTWDGKDWHPLIHPYWPVLETSPPPLCAPHHERFDQAVVYEAIGLNESSVFRNIVGRWDPYGHGGVPSPLVMLRRILQGDLPGTCFYDRSIEAGRGRPVAVRTRTYMLEPTTLEELRVSGRWWTRTLVGPHFPPMTLDDGYWDAPLPAPELWAYDDVVWLRRSHLGPLMERARSGESPHALVSIHAEDELTADDVEAFWSAFVPSVAARDRGTWQGLRGFVRETRERFGRPRLHRFERIAGRCAALLQARLEPLFLDQGLSPALGKVKASLDVKSPYHLRLLAFDVIAQGREVFDAVFADPLLARDHAGRTSLASGAYLPALFRYESFVYQAYKQRLIESSLEHGGRPDPTPAQKAKKARGQEIATRLFGGLDMMVFLKTQFTTEEDVLDVPERLPRFVIQPDTEVKRVAAPAEQVG